MDSWLQRAPEFRAHNAPAWPKAPRQTALRSPHPAEHGE